MQTEEVETTRYDMDNKDPDDIDFGHLARYAWLASKGVRSLSRKQADEMFFLASVIIEGINFTSHQIEVYLDAAYKAYKKGYLWEDWRAELENLDTHMMLPSLYTNTDIV
jgi:hypothetical protein